MTIPFILQTDGGSILLDLSPLEPSGIRRQLAAWMQAGDRRWQAAVDSFELTSGMVVPKGLSYLAAWFADDAEVAERLGLDISVERGQLLQVLSPVARLYLEREGVAPTESAVRAAVDRQWHAREGTVGSDEVLDLFTAAWWRKEEFTLNEQLIPGKEYPRVFLTQWEEYFHVGSDVNAGNPYRVASVWRSNGLEDPYSAVVGGIHHEVAEGTFDAWPNGAPHKEFLTPEEAFNYIVDAARVQWVRAAMGV